MPKLPSDKQKRLAADAAVEFVEPMMIVGLGTGSTAELAIRRLAEKVRRGLKITAVPTSISTELLARRLRIPLVKDVDAFTKIDLTFDGADEVDPSFNLIKGGGGALTREKIVASRSNRQIIIIDEKKQVERLGKFAVPVETLPFGWKSTMEILRGFGARASLRAGKTSRKPFITDNGNYILDCSFGLIYDPAELEEKIKGIFGVVEVGLFIGLADVVLVGRGDGTVTERWNV
jgi:ribose 5-phosphate isomerase A